VAVRVGIPERVIQNVGVFVERLGILYVCVGQRANRFNLITRKWIDWSACPFIRGRKPALGRGVVAGQKVIEAN